MVLSKQLAIITSIIRPYQTSLAADVRLFPSTKMATEPEAAKHDGW